MKCIKTRETVLFYDTDCGGVVSNIAYLRYIERARCTLLAELGMELTAMNETNLFPAVIRTEVDYLSPARLGDEVEVSAWMEGAERGRATCGFELSVSGERVVARAKQIVALVQMPSGRPRRIPADWFTDNESGESF